MTTPSSTKTAVSKKPSKKSHDSSKADFRSDKTLFARSFRKQTIDFIRREQLFKNNDRLLLALSGGPDSVALLHFLLSIKKTFCIDLSVAHINYRLRKTASDNDECFVRELCQKYKIPLFIHRPKVKKADEESLRIIRYAFFEKIRKEKGCSVIAVAHHRDDQAETVLLRLLRGSGEEGLQAMTPRRDFIVRPFLTVSKKDILRYLKEERLPYHIDQTNTENIYLRNRIRNQLIPYIERKFQPNIKEVLSRTADTFRNSVQTAPTPPLPNGLLKECTLSRKQFLALSKEAQRESLRFLYKHITDSPLPPKLSFVRECQKMLESRKSKLQTLLIGELKIEARGDKVTLIRR